MPRGDGTGPRGQGAGTGKGIQDEVAVVRAEEEVLRQARAVIVSVPNVVKEFLTN